MNNFLQKIIFYQKNLNLVLLMVFVFAMSPALAQDVAVSGQVLSETGDAIPGATILEVGTSNGTVSDIDGNYTISVSSGNAVLRVSFIGYTTQEIALEGRSTITINLEPDVQQLEEIVVVGYGSVKKSDITGSVESVKSEDLQAFPALDAAQALQGRAAGVVVQSNNGGEPGAPISIKIRGNTSLTASSNPLIVVDGFVGAAMPQQNDIESIEILKDASATAIYGSRGSNGVVMVTTKKGVKGRFTVELNSSFSSSQTANELDLLNADEFATYQQILNPSYTQGTANTDWQDELYQKGGLQNHQLSFSGGSEKVNFYASANYFTQEGVIVNSDFERFTFLSNVDAQITDKLKMGINLFASRETKNGIATQSDGESANGGGDDVVGLMFRFTPDRGITNDDGSYTINSVGDDVDNPWAVATQRVNETIADRNRANLYLDYEIIEGLSFKTTFGFSSLNENIGTYVPSTLTIQDQGNGGKADINNRQSNSVISENYLTYKKEIGKGNLSVLAGYSYQKNTTSRFSAGSTGLIKDSYSYHNLSGAANATFPTSSLVESEIQSLFARANYDFDDKYLITATVRRDGASNFSENEKYAVFPSGAIGWRISNEGFLKDNSTISNLKLRASYGLTGNQAIAPYSAFAKLTDVQGLSGGQIVSGVTPDQAANANLKWETSYQTNIGLDLGFIDDRITASLNYYNIDTKDLLLNNYNQPQYLGFATSAAVANVGEINNSGFEITLNTVNIDNNDFKWTSNFNLSTNKTEVISLIGGEDVLLDASPSYFSRSDTHILREGETPGVFYGYEYRGVYQGGALPEGTAMLANGVEGDPLFTDIADEDGTFNGVIDTGDRTIIGDPTPDFTWGFNNTLTYKGFDLNIFIQGSKGGDIFNLTKVQLYNGDGNTIRENLENAWTPENTNTNIPRIGNNSARELSSRFVEDGSYVRLKNLALGYSLPSDIVEKLRMQSVRFSISAQNLLTITDYSGLDPEVNYLSEGGDSGDDVNSNTTNGFDYGNYPTVRSYTFSVNLKF
ncbi:MAG: TonB-dependent receptor [Reichenbachiella sp.]